MTNRWFKYADDMALVGGLQKTDPLGEAAYVAHTKTLQTWCHAIQLEVNMSKKKWLIF